MLRKSDVLYGEMVHCVAMKMGFVLELYFCNTLIEVYAKCGCLSYAYKVFDEMLQRDLVTWTSMISGFVSEGNVSNAFSLFNKMRFMELEPNSVTVLVMLQACSTFGNLLEGRQFHGYIIKIGLLVDTSVQNSILRMYTKRGSVEEVEVCFGEIDRRDVFTWNILISFHSSRGDIEEVANRFNEMQGEVAISIETLSLVISVFGKSGNVIEGKKLQGFAIKVGLCDNVLLTSLLDFYAKCGELGNATQLFSEIPHRNNITWNAMMSGFIQNGHFNEAIELFRQMQAANLKPDAVILRGLVDAYSNLSALQWGKAIHGYLIRNILYDYKDDNTQLETSILNMYIRCGNITSAREYFNRMLVRDIVTWTSMIEGYGIHGLGYESLNLFKQMVESGISPNSVTFLSLLSACSHSGLVRKGGEVFYCMKWRFGIEADLDHYTCMVDLLGRSGKLKEALAIIIKLVVFPDSRIWGALLASSRIHGDRKLGEYVAQRLMELEPDNVGYYTLLCNIQASVGQWVEVEEVRRVMNEKNLKKKPAWSCIQEKGKIHGFVSGNV
ncbi:hypothetical protein JRO89_XSUnG0111900 [Xanthoceras sorbifolium]|uniref:Pentatricopeptide repeat-containing protein n=1 Tax=Xanthoceras sorbifolium TaxID=99658 RepID=A0ABQ8GYI8_9ROSI|nr:hypothetical protein JRO89_XSUnG0111900 [Xanthoceras sorbifolium]